MVELVRQVPPGAMSVNDTPFLAADVGGTHARIGLVQGSSSGVSMLAYRKYACADYPDLVSILRDFLTNEAHVSVDRCALAIAGYVIDGMVINYNLPWKVSIRGTARWPRHAPAVSDQRFRSRRPWCALHRTRQDSAADWPRDRQWPDRGGGTRHRPGLRGVHPG